MAFHMLLSHSLTRVSEIVVGMPLLPDADIQTAATRVVTTWAVAMPVAAAQLVLSTAAADGALVGVAGWTARLPLVATGLVTTPLLLTALTKPAACIK